MGDVGPPSPKGAAENSQGRPWTRVSLAEEPCKRGTRWPLAEWVRRDEI